MINDPLFQSSNFVSNLATSSCLYLFHRRSACTQRLLLQRIGHLKTWLEITPLGIMPHARLYRFTVYGLNFSLDKMSLIVFKVFVKFRLSINYNCLVRVCRKSVIAGMQILCSIFILFCVSLNVTPITIDCVFRRDM